MKHKFFLLLFLLSSFFEKPKNLIKSNNLSKNIIFQNDYTTLILNTIKAIDMNCYNELMIDLSKNEAIESDKKYPWLIDYIGKGLNDLGDEIECNNCILDTTYMIATINTLAYVKEESSKLLNFLEKKNFAFGICIINECKSIVEMYFKKLVDVIKTLTDNKDDGGDILIFEEYEENKNSYKGVIILIFLVYIILKISLGIVRLIFIPKGYDKYVAELLQNEGKLDNIDIEEKKTFFERNSNNEILMNEEAEYNRVFDLGTYFPFKIKIFRFFDFFNDVFLLISKRNNYYNDKGLETILFMRSIVIIFLIFYCTFYSLVSLPSKEIFNESFFTSLSIGVYKVSINSLTCWIVLEGANTTYKLMKFINLQMKEKRRNNKKRPEIKLLLILGKFLILYIPKIFIFFIIYYFFYYKVKDFEYIVGSKKTFSYIINHMFNKDIKCGEKFLDIFKYNFVFNNNINDYNDCYEFTYIYFNIFFCSLIFMIILYLSFLFRSKIFEIFIILINTILFFSSVWLIKDEKVSKSNPKYTYYHFTGQKYSTKVLFSLISFYHIGYMLGFFLFHYDNNKYKYIYKLDSKELINNNNKKIEIEEIEKEKNEKEDNDNNNIKYNLNYYPLSFLNIFLSLINKMNTSIKKIIIVICIILIITPSIVFQIIFRSDDKHFELDLSTKIKLYYYYEKHIFIILFFIINIVLLTMPKKGLFKKFINLRMFFAISRSGFTIVCLYYFIGYVCFSSFYIQVKFHIPTFILISIGNLLIVFIICFLINIIFELPLKIAVKKLLKLNNK